VLEIQSKIAKYDGEARKFARLHSFLVLLPIILIAIVWIALIFYIGWDRMEYGLMFSLSAASLLPTSFGLVFARV
jgi:hypothetical protein